MVGPEFVRGFLAELYKDANVNVISPHKARHTEATLVQAATCDLHAVKKMLGHSQISLTANLSRHGTAERQRWLAYALSDRIVPKDDQGGVLD